ncbi:O-antigen ligase family protein [Candidatus Woesebacteria bacterium]|nr:MAG: O-antigen ligase family protein [Candidatus Woesebacteria bacterium]
MHKLSERFNTPLKYLVAAAILAVPLYPKFPFIKVPGTFVSIRLEDFVIAILACIWFVAVLPTVKNILKDPVTKAILLYIAIGFVSLMSAVYVTNTVSLSIGFLHWLRRIEYLIPFFVGSYVISVNRSNLYFYFKLLLVVITGAFIYGYGQIHFLWPIIITQNQEYAKGVALRWIPGSHVNSTFAGHYDLATFLVLVMSLIVPAIFLLKGKINKAVLTTVFFFALWLLANAASRVSLVSYLISIVISCVFVKRYKPILLVVLISVIYFASSSVIITRYERIYEVIQSKLLTANIVEIARPTYASEVVQLNESKIENQQASPQPEDRSSSIRINVEWPRALRAFTKNPLVGTGYSSITLATDNDYLRALGETGLLGLLSFALIFINMLTAYIRRLPFPRHYSNLELVFVAGFLAALPGLFLNAVFIDIFEASKFAISFWFIAGFSYSLIKNDHLNK